MAECKFAPSCNVIVCHSVPICLNEIACLICPLLHVRVQPLLLPLLKLADSKYGCGPKPNHMEHTAILLVELEHKSVLYLPLYFPLHFLLLLIPFDACSHYKTL